VTGAAVLRDDLRHTAIDHPDIDLRKVMNAENGPGRVESIPPGRGRFFVP